MNLYNLKFSVTLILMDKHPSYYPIFLPLIQKYIAAFMRTPSSFIGFTENQRIVYIISRHFQPLLFFYFYIFILNSNFRIYYRYTLNFSV